MDSIGVKTLRSQYPSNSDAELATQLAEEDGHIAVLRFKSRREQGLHRFCDMHTK